MNESTLPTETQRKALCELMSEAFVELRYLEGDQAHDLAYAFHNLPKAMHGWGTWSAEGLRAGLQRYQSKHKANLGFDYVSAWDRIFPEADPNRSTTG